MRTKIVGGAPGPKYSIPCPPRRQSEIIGGGGENVIKVTVIVEKMSRLRHYIKMLKKFSEQEKDVYFEIVLKEKNSMILMDEEMNCMKCPSCNREVPDEDNFCV